LGSGVLVLRNAGSKIGIVASSLVTSQLACQSDTAYRSTAWGHASQVLTFWHLASMDAPTVAVVWALAIARSVQVHLQPWIIFLLAGGTWTVYVLDRLLDARQAIRANALAVLRERHYFHWRHRRTFLALAACTAAGAAALIVILMPVAAQQHNSLIAIAALAYFSGVHAPTRLPRWLRQVCSKEMLVGILFAVGCAAPTLTRLHPAASPWPIVLSLAFFAVLAWLNCAAISSWESPRTSRTIPAAIIGFAVAGLAIAICLPPPLAPTSALLSSAALSAILLLALHQFRHRLAPVTLRALADLVLLVPALLLIPGVLPR
jgi:hypothetical protein